TTASPPTRSTSRRMPSSCRTAAAAPCSATRWGTSSTTPRHRPTIRAGTCGSGEPPPSSRRRPRSNGRRREDRGRVSAVALRSPFDRQAAQASPKRWVRLAVEDLVSGPDAGEAVEQDAEALVGLHPGQCGTQAVEGTEAERRV